MSIGVVHKDDATHLLGLHDIHIHDIHIHDTHILLLHLFHMRNLAGAHNFLSFYLGFICESENEKQMNNGQLYDTL